VTLEGFVLSTGFATNEGQLKVVSILSNSTLASFVVPVAEIEAKSLHTNVKESLPEEMVKAAYRKVDKGA
jgi:hypothetical protein